MNIGAKPQDYLANPNALPNVLGELSRAVNAGGAVGARPSGVESLIGEIEELHRRLPPSTDAKDPVAIVGKLLAMVSNVERLDHLNLGAGDHSYISDYFLMVRHTGADCEVWLKNDLSNASHIHRACLVRLNYTKIPLDGDLFDAIAGVVVAQRGGTATKAQHKQTLNQAWTDLLAVAVEKNIADCNTLGWDHRVGRDTISLLLREIDALKWRMGQHLDSPKCRNVMNAANALLGSAPGSAFAKRLATYYAAEQKTIADATSFSCATSIADGRKVCAPGYVQHKYYWQGNGWEFSRLVLKPKDPPFWSTLDGDETNAARAIEVLADFCSDELASANESTLEERQMEFVRYLKQALFGCSEAIDTHYDPYNKFDTVIDAGGRAVSKMNTLRAKLPALSFGFRYVEQYLSAQEAAVFKTKFQLLAANIFDDFVPDFSDYRAHLGPGRNLGVSDIQFTKLVEKLTDQVNACEEKTATTAASGFAITRSRNGKASITLPPAGRGRGVTLDGLMLRAHGHILEVFASKPTLARKMRVGIPSATWSEAEKTQWLAEIIASGLVPLHTSTSFDNSNELDKALVRLSILSPSVSSATFVDLASSSSDDWIVRLPEMRFNGAVPYPTPFITSYAESNCSPPSRYFQKRTLGAISIMQDMQKDLSAFALNSEGRTSSKFNAAIAKVSETIIGADGKVAKNKLKEEWDNNLEGMSAAVRCLWNAGCREFGFEYQDVSFDGILQGNLKPPRIRESGPDYEALANLSELLSIIEAPYLDNLPGLVYYTSKESGTELNYDDRDWNVKVAKVLAELGCNTSFLMRRRHVIKFRSNVDFSGEPRMLSQGILGTHDDSTIVFRPYSKPTNSDSGTTQAMHQTFRMTFDQQLAMYRMQLQVLSVEIPKIMLAAAKCESCTLGNGYRFNHTCFMRDSDGTYCPCTYSGGDVIDPEVFSGHDMGSRQCGSCTGGTTGGYWVSTLEHAFISIFYLGMQDPRRVSPSMSIALANMGEKLMQMTASCCKSCQPRASIGAVMAIAAKNAMPQRYPGYPQLFWSEAGTADYLGATKATAVCRGYCFVSNTSPGGEAQMEDHPEASPWDTPHFAKKADSATDPSRGGLRRCFKDIGGFGPTGLFLSGNQLMTAGFGVLKGGDAAYYERFGRESAPLGNVGQAVRFPSDRYSSDGITVSVDRGTEPWSIDIETCGNSGNLFFDNSGVKAARLIRNREEAIACGLGGIVPEALMGDEYDMWFVTKTDESIMSAHMNKVFFARRDASVRKGPTIDFELQTHSNEAAAIFDLRKGRGANERRVLYANSRPIGASGAEASGLEYFSSFTGGDPNAILVTGTTTATNSNSENFATRANRDASARNIVSDLVASGQTQSIATVEISGLRYDHETPLHFESTQHNGTERLMLTRHASLHVVPRLIARTNPATGVAEAVNPLFSFAKGIVLEDIDSHGSRYELLVRTNDLFVHTSPPIGKQFAGSVIKTTYRPRDHSSIGDTYFSENPAGYLALATLALRNIPPKETVAAELIRKARTNSGAALSQIEVELYGELISTIDNLPDCGAKPHLRMLCKLRSYCDRGADYIASMGSEEFNSELNYLAKYATSEETARTGAARPHRDYRLVLSAGEMTRYMQLFTDAIPIKTKAWLQKESDKSMKAAAARWKTALTSVATSAVKIAKAEEPVQEPASVTSSIGRRAQDIGAMLKVHRQFQLDVLRNANSAALAKAHLHQTTRDLTQAKDGLEKALNGRIANRGLKASDAVPLLLLVGQKKDDADKCNVARFMTRLRALNSELTNPPDAETIFDLTVKYASLLCRYNFLKTAASGAKPPIEEADEAEFWDPGQATLHIVALAWEAMEGIVLRREQLLRFVNSITSVTSSTERARLGGAAEGSIVPTVMGGGKTKVMMPIGCMVFDAQGYIPVCIAPSSMAASMAADLMGTFGQSMSVVYLGAVAGSTTKADWLSTFTKDIDALRRIWEEIRVAGADGGKVIVIDDCMMNRMVMETTILSEQVFTGAEGLQSSTMDDGSPSDMMERLHLLSRILSTFKERSRLLVDEAHKVFDPMRSLITTDQSNADKHVDDRIFDVVEQTYYALVEEDDTQVKQEVSLQKYTRGHDSKWAKDTRQPPLTWASGASGLAAARTAARLSTNGQAAMSASEYDSDVAPAVARHIIAYLFSTQTFSTIGCGVRYVDGNPTADVGDLQFEFAFGKEGCNLQFCVKDLVGYLTKPSYASDEGVAAELNGAADEAGFFEAAQRLYDGTAAARSLILDRVFDRALSGGTSLVPLFKELALVRGLLSTELPRCLEKTAGVAYGDGSSGAALRVYKEGTPTNAQFAHLGTSIPLHFQFVANAGMPRAVWNKYIDGTLRSAALQMARDSSIVSIDKTPAGLLFAEAFSGGNADAEDGRTMLPKYLHMAKTQPDLLFVNCCRYFRANPGKAIKLMRNFIDNEVRPPTVMRETRSTAALRFFREITAFTGTPGVAHKWPQQFSRKFPDIPKHIHDLRSISRGESDVTGSGGKQIGKKLLAIRCVDCQHDIGAFLDSVTNARPNQTHVSNRDAIDRICAICDPGGVFYQMAANNARIAGNLEPDPGYWAARYTQEWFSNNGRQVSVAYEDRDGNRRMLTPGATDGIVFEGSGMAVLERFGIKPSNTIWATSQAMCTGLDVPMPHKGILVNIPHLAGTTEDIFFQTAMRARALMAPTDAPLSQYTIVAMPDTLLQRAVWSGRNERGIPDSVLSRYSAASSQSARYSIMDEEFANGEVLLATLQHNDVEVAKKQTMMAALSEIGRCVGNWVVGKTVDAFARCSGASGEQVSSAMESLRPVVCALSKFLSNSNDFIPEQVYLGSKVEISLTDAALATASSMRAQVLAALREAQQNETPLGLEVMEFFDRECRGLLDICASAEGVKIGTDPDGHPMKVNCEDGDIQKEPLGQIVISSKQSSSGAEEAAENNTVEVEVETEKEHQAQAEEQQEYNECNAMSPGRKLPLCNYWSTCDSGVRAYTVFENKYTNPTRGHGGRTQLAIFGGAKNCPQTMVQSSLPAAQFMRKSAGEIPWKADGLACADRYLTYENIFGPNVRVSINFGASFANAIPIVHDSQPKPRYAFIYKNQTGDDFTIVLATEEEAAALVAAIKADANKIAGLAIVDASTGSCIERSRGFDPYIKGDIKRYDAAVSHLRLLRAMMDGDANAVTSQRSAFAALVESCGGDLPTLNRFLRICIYAIPESRLDNSMVVVGQKSPQLRLSALRTIESDILLQVGIDISRDLIEDAKSIHIPIGSLERIRPGEVPVKDIAKLSALQLDKFLAADRTRHAYSSYLVYQILLCATLSGSTDTTRRLLGQSDQAGAQYILESVRSVASTKSKIDTGDSQLFRLALMGGEYGDAYYESAAAESNDLGKRCGLFNTYSPSAFCALGFGEQALSQIFATTDGVSLLEAEQVKKVSKLNPLFERLISIGSVELLAKMSGRQLCESKASARLRARPGESDGESMLDEVAAKLLECDANGVPNQESEAALVDILSFCVPNSPWIAAIAKSVSSERLQRISNNQLIRHMFRFPEFIAAFKGAPDVVGRLTDEFTPLLTESDVERLKWATVEAFPVELRRLLCPWQIIRIHETTGTALSEILLPGRLQDFDELIDLEKSCKDGGRIEQGFVKLLMAIVRGDGAPAITVDDITDKQIELLMRHSLAVDVRKCDVDCDDVIPQPRMPSEAVDGGGEKVAAKPAEFIADGSPLHVMLSTRLSKERIARISSDECVSTVYALLANAKNNAAIGQKQAAILSRDMVRKSPGKAEMAQALDEIGSATLSNAVIARIKSRSSALSACLRGAEGVVSEKDGESFLAEHLAANLAFVIAIDDKFGDSADIACVAVLANMHKTFGYGPDTDKFSDSGFSTSKLWQAVWDAALTQVAHAYAANAKGTSFTGALNAAKTAKTSGTPSAAGWLACMESDAAFVLTYADFLLLSQRMPRALARLRERDIESISKSLKGADVAQIIRLGSCDAISALNETHLRGFMLTAGAQNLIQKIDLETLAQIKPEASILEEIVRHGSTQQVASMTVSQLLSVGIGAWRDRNVERKDEECVTPIFEKLKAEIASLVERGRGAKQDCSELRTRMAVIARTIAGVGGNAKLQGLIDKLVAKGTNSKDLLTNLLADKDWHQLDTYGQLDAFRLFALMIPGKTLEKRRKAISDSIAAAKAKVGDIRPKGIIDNARVLLSSENSNVAKLFGVAKIVDDAAKPHVVRWIAAFDFDDQNSPVRKSMRDTGATTWPPELKLIEQVLLVELTECCVGNLENDVFAKALPTMTAVAKAIVGSLTAVDASNAKQATGAARLVIKRAVDEIESATHDSVYAIDQIQHLADTVCGNTASDANIARKSLLDASRGGKVDTTDRRKILAAAGTQWFNLSEKSLEVRSEIEKNTSPITDRFNDLVTDLVRKCKAESSLAIMECTFITPNHGDDVAMAAEIKKAYLDGAINLNGMLRANGRGRTGRNLGIGRHSQLAQLAGAEADGDEALRSVFYTVPSLAALTRIRDNARTLIDLDARGRGLTIGAESRTSGAFFAGAILHLRNDLVSTFASTRFPHTVPTDIFVEMANSQSTGAIAFPDVWNRDMLAKIKESDSVLYNDLVAMLLVCGNGAISNISKADVLEAMSTDFCKGQIVASTEAMIANLFAASAEKKSKKTKDMRDRMAGIAREINTSDSEANYAKIMLEAQLIRQQLGVLDQSAGEEHESSLQTQKLVAYATEADFLGNCGPYLIECVSEDQALTTALPVEEVNNTAKAASSGAGRDEQSCVAAETAVQLADAVIRNGAIDQLNRLDHTAWNEDVTEKLAQQLAVSFKRLTEAASGSERDAALAKLTRLEGNLSNTTNKLIISLMLRASTISGDPDVEKRLLKCLDAVAKRNILSQSRFINNYDGPVLQASVARFFEHFAKQIPYHIILLMGPLMNGSQWMHVPGAWFKTVAEDEDAKSMLKLLPVAAFGSTLPNATTEDIKHRAAAIVAYGEKKVLEGLSETSPVTLYICDPQNHLLTKNYGNLENLSNPQSIIAAILVGGDVELQKSQSMDAIRKGFESEQQNSGSSPIVKSIPVANPQFFIAVARNFKDASGEHEKAEALKKRSPNSKSAILSCSRKQTEMANAKFVFLHCIAAVLKNCAPADILARIKDNLVGEQLETLMASEDSLELLRASLSTNSHQEEITVAQIQACASTPFARLLGCDAVITIGGAVDPDKLAAAVRCCDGTQLNEFAASHGGDLLGLAKEGKLAIASDFFDKKHDRTLKSEVAFIAAIHMAQCLKTAIADQNAAKNRTALFKSIRSEALKDFSGTLAANHTKNDRLKMFGEIGVADTLVIFNVKSIADLKTLDSTLLPAAAAAIGVAYQTESQIGGGSQQQLLELANTYEGIRKTNKAIPPFTEGKLACLMIAKRDPDHIQACAAAAPAPTTGFASRRRAKQSTGTPA
ncbi:MAG: hypothetical protein LBI39_02435 [Puniceicoccales bacterium]|jgi:hypothetical protein|nr:hypothetical protein [Puniceicoccales bacterium]